MESTKIFEIDGVGPVRFVKRASSKHIKLSIEQSGKVKVSLPKRASFFAARTFVESKKSWIISRLQELPKQEAASQGLRIGKAHTLTFFRSVASSKPVVTVKQNCIKISYPVSMQESDGAVQQAARRGIEKALKIEAEALLPRRLQELAQKHNFSYASVGVKKLKTRWGSCSNKQEITLNFNLMNLPWEMIDYVLIHELTHTKFMHHQKPFWDHLAEKLPDYKRIRKELKTQKNF